MTFIIPNQETKKHSQLNDGDLSGTIYQSKNISLDENGYVKLADATYAQYTTDNDSNFDTADAMCASSDEIFINSAKVFSGLLGVDALTSRSADTNAPSPSVEEDVVYFNATEVVSDGVNIKYRSATTTWTTVSGAVTSASFPTVMTTWSAENCLVVGNSNVVSFVNTSWVVNSTVLTLPSEYQLSTVESNGSQLYIGTRSKSGGDAKMFVVSTIQTSADYAYPVNSFELMSLKQFKSSVAGINSLGQLVRFNGGGFDVLAKLPVYASSIEWCDAIDDYSTVSNRAMVVDGDLIYVNLSALTQNGKFKVLPNFPSGIWCYDDTNQSFYPKYSPSYSRVETISGGSVTVNTTDNNFTLTSGNLNNVMTGMPVLFFDGSGTLIPDLRQSTCYFLIKDSSTVFRLATSYANAVAGTAIDITGAGNSFQEWYVYKTNDYGWSEYDSRMSVAILNNKLFDSEVSGRLAYTADLHAKQSASTEKTVFGGTNPFIPNRGYFVTPRLNSSNIEDVYNTIYLKFKPLGDDDKIIVKYKVVDRYEFPFCSRSNSVSSKWYGTWTDTDTFTTTADFSDVIVGDEIEIRSGVGAGHIAHVASISVNTGTYTVNLDEAFPFAVASDVMTFQVDNFTKLETITSSSKDAGRNFAEISVNGIANTSQYIMVKVELRGIGTTIAEMQVYNKKFK